MTPYPSGCFGDSRTPLPPAWREGFPELSRRLVMAIVAGTVVVHLFPGLRSTLVLWPGTPVSYDKAKLAILKLERDSTPSRGGGLVPTWAATPPPPGVC